MAGMVGILSVGAGDVTLSFDPKNPMEAARAARIVADMLKRGYCLFVEVGKDAENQPQYRRAEKFDAKTAEYIIADFDPFIAAEADAKEDIEDRGKPQDEAKGAVPSKASKPAPRRGGRTKRVPAASTNAVAVARTAGG